MVFLGVTILQGVEFSIFLIDFEWALQQCSATALPVISCRRMLLFTPRRLDDSVILSSDVCTMSIIVQTCADMKDDIIVGRVTPWSKKQ